MSRELRAFGPGERWQELDNLREAYPEFKPFLYDVITGLLGFNCTPLQLDIASFLEHGPQYRMIQAQRGQAKTTITAAYAVWRQIHDPTTRILIVSSGSDMATEIANWVIQIIMGMDELECLRPDRSAGDRESVKAFDIHYELKGPEKSPSIACIGITSNMQGKRADVLIADDVESSKNSATEIQRERLKHLTKDFTSINSKGDIIYLGTPQSIDSIYNGLPGRGFTIRIWPGRFPTADELPNYGKHLAPAIRAALEKKPSLQTGGGPMGDRGQPTDPVLLDEQTLTAKEIDQGAAYFQLQHMLDTRLSDAERFPLKSEKLIFMNFTGPEQTRGPLEVQTHRQEVNLIRTPQDFPTEDNYFRAQSLGNEWGDWQGTHMYVDPAGGGQNGDETAYAVTQFLAGRVFVREIGAVPGGLDEASLNALTAVAARWKPTQIDIEKNFGNGALSSVWTPKLLQVHPAHIEDVWESGQKELRIIDVLEPVIGSGRLIMDEEMLEDDWRKCQKYPVEKRPSYSLFFQLSRITREKGALIHDDRLDALAGSVRFWADHLKQDEKKAQAKAATQRYMDQMSNPLGNGRKMPGFSKHIRGMNRHQPNALARMHRR